MKEILEFQRLVEKIADDFGTEDVSARMHERETAAVRDRHAQVQLDEGIGWHRRINFREQILETFSGGRRNKDFVFAVPVRLNKGSEFVRSKTIGLVEDVHARTILHAEIRKNFQHLGILLGVMRARDVGDVEYQRRFLHFFKRGAECSDQIRGQIAQESTVSERSTRRCEGSRTAEWWDRASQTFWKTLRRLRA